VGEAARIIKSTTGFSGFISQSRRYIIEGVSHCDGPYVAAIDLSEAVSYLRALDLAESLPVTQIAREVYASASSAILNHARTIEND
jgi:hypothetical protein